MAWLLDIPLGWLTLPALGVVALLWTIAEEVCLRRAERRDAEVQQAREVK